MRKTYIKVHGKRYNLYKEFSSSNTANEFVKYKLDRDVYKNYRIQKGRYTYDLFVR